MRNPVPKFDRRTFVKLATVAAIGAATPVRAAAAKVTVAEAMNETMTKFMSERSIPGGSLAVLRHGRLVFARGYGMADTNAQIPAREDSLFRIASISKPITAVAILQLAERKKLNLDDPFSRLGIDPVVLPGETFDERLRHISIRHLLQHSGGWDRDRSYDPMFRPCEIAEALGVAGPASARDVTRYMLGRRLDFEPGSRYAYSNLGYCLLGRIIEAVTGDSYDHYVRTQVLAPAGIRKMRLGSSREQAPDEVRYYTPKSKPIPSVFECDSSNRSLVEPAYGGFHLEAMDAHGGWIASALDLARFAAALDVPGKRPLLKPAAMQWLLTPPNYRAAASPLPATYYGAGWMVRPVKAGANTWHSGSLPGTATMLVRRADGVSWVALFNQRSTDRQLPDTAIDGLINQASSRVTEWPKGTRL